MEERRQTEDFVELVHFPGRQLICAQNGFLPLCKYDRQDVKVLFLALYHVKNIVCQAAQNNDRVC